MLTNHSRCEIWGWQHYAVGTLLFLVGMGEVVTEDYWAIIEDFFYLGEGEECMESVYILVLFVKKYAGVCGCKMTNCRCEKFCKVL